LPRTRGEDAAFRAAVQEGRAQWRSIHERCDDDGQVIGRFAVHDPEATTAEGYRLLWFHSARKAGLDALARHKRLEWVATARTELRAKLTSPRTRYREHAKVAQAVDAILREGEGEGLVVVTVAERTTEKEQDAVGGARLTIEIGAELQIGITVTLYNGEGKKYACKSRFSREFKRFFGVTPVEEAEHMRVRLVAG
jgi:hypothetical protein